MAAKPSEPHGACCIITEPKAQKPILSCTARTRRYVCHSTVRCAVRQQRYSGRQTNANTTQTAGFHKPRSGVQCSNDIHPNTQHAQREIKHRHTGTDAQTDTGTTQQLQDHDSRKSVTHCCAAAAAVTKKGPGSYPSPHHLLLLVLLLRRQLGNARQLLGRSATFRAMSWAGSWARLGQVSCGPVLPASCAHQSPPRLCAAPGPACGAKFSANRGWGEGCRRYVSQPAVVLRCCTCPPTKPNELNSPEQD